MAEAGTDSYEREKGFQLMNRESDYYKSLTKALERIDDGSFGVCTVIWRIDSRRKNDGGPQHNQTCGM